jgi:LPS-assembly protein
MIGLEITETAILPDVRAAALEIASARELGVKVALDDFGTGHSSLTLLRSLPIDRVKIDQTFVSELGHDERATAIVRSVINVERIDPNSYISIAGWAFQGLRVDDVQKEIPIALPAIDARFRMDEVAGGKIELEANSLSIIRLEGQDTQRAFASARWDLRRLTPWGQELVLTAYGRGDVYHTDDAEARRFRSIAEQMAGIRG